MSFSFNDSDTYENFEEGEKKPSLLSAFRRVTDPQDLKKELASGKADFFEWLEIIVSSVIVVIFLFTFLFRVATIDGSSMENTLFHGEKIIITDFGYAPKQGDIVVISRNKTNTIGDEDPDDQPIIKRVIAVEGQTVDIDFITGKVYVDGKAINEPYAKTATTRMFDVNFPLIVDEGCIFVLGDNRNESHDSRSSDIGLVDTRYVLGHAVIRILPFERMGRLDSKTEDK